MERNERAGGRAFTDRRGPALSHDVWQELQSISDVSHGYETLVSNLHLLTATRPIKSK
jgi:hypothetical protein